MIYWLRLFFHQKQPEIFDVIIFIIYCPPFPFLWYYVGMTIFDVETMREKIAEIAKKRNLKLVALFGSQATGKIHAKSDIDIAFIGKNPIDFDAKLQLMTDFSDALKREDVEAVDLGIASPTLMRAVVRDGQILFEETRGDFLRWKFYAIKIWLETAWLRTLRDKQLTEWAERA